MSVVYEILHAVCFFSFFVPTAFAFYHWVRAQPPLSLKFILLNTGFALLIGALFISFALLDSRPQDAHRVELFFDSVCFLLYSWILNLITRFLFELLQWPWEGWRRHAVFMASWSGPALLMSAHFLFFDGLERLTALRFFVNGIYLPFFLVWIVAVFCIALFSLRSVEDRWKRDTLFGAGLIFFLGIPFNIVDVLWPWFQVEWHLIPRGMVISILVFLAWNVFFTLRWMAFPSYQPLSAPDQGGLDLNHDRLLLLTPQERRVVVMILEGRSNAEISRILGVTPGTAKNHVYKAYIKTGASNRDELRHMLLNRKV